MNNQSYEKSNQEMRKDPKGKPTKKAMALKKWGFGSIDAARSFCQANKEKKS